ncbi:hypothetical protein GGX14DRAFT_679098 [Mycena pura]|uniref:Uncharacterized protein n=1 Tax=Mycena pura TaxID=153505 RepID=A0AAD6UXQ1_9AGAR|nr:hypothetical protein GGX14DRAFT_679098 [Mycena pura]
MTCHTDSRLFFSPHLPAPSSCSIATAQTLRIVADDNISSKNLSASFVLRAYMLTRIPINSCQFETSNPLVFVDVIFGFAEDVLVDIHASNLCAAPTPPNSTPTSQVIFARALQDSHPPVRPRGPPLRTPYVQHRIHVRQPKNPRSPAAPPPDPSQRAAPAEVRTTITERLQDHRYIFPVDSVGGIQTIPSTEGAYQDIYRNHMRNLSDTRAAAPVALHRVLHKLDHIVIKSTAATATATGSFSVLIKLVEVPDSD